MRTKIINAIILAAGTSSRFVPLSLEKPKGLLNVKGEVLIERQIRQLQEAGIFDITIVVGYRANMFDYLKEKFGVKLILNEDYHRYNNSSSMIRILDRLGDTYICSSDNYFPKNVFINNPVQSYYSALFASGNTKEYCISVNENDEIENVSNGGNGSWYMIGHVFFSRDFSHKFAKILTKEYTNENTRYEYWEDVYIRNIDKLPPMKIHRYNKYDIEEFDSIDELRAFDNSYISDTRSKIIKDIAFQMECDESELYGFSKTSSENNDSTFYFMKSGVMHSYDIDKRLIKLV